MYKVEILLATYNGEKYLNELLESIINQSFKDWQLLIRDDNSNDNTLKIINEFIQKSNRIKLIDDNYGNMGVVKNFEILMINSTADFIMFADQDDVWFEKKIETIYKIIKNEPKEKPIIVHSDVLIVDKNLNICKSFFIGSIGLRKGLKNLIFSGKVQGASMMFNRALLLKALPFPNEIKMHDYYLSLVNEKFGERFFLNSALMYYRQHEDNLIGASVEKESIVKKLLFKSIEMTSEKNKNDVKIFKDVFKEELTLKDGKIIEDYFFINNDKENRVKRIFKLFKNNFFPLYKTLGYSFKIAIKKA